MHLPVLQQVHTHQPGHAQAGACDVLEMRAFLVPEERQTGPLPQMQVCAMGHQRRRVHVQEVLPRMGGEEERDSPQMPQMPEHSLERGP